MVSEERPNSTDRGTGRVTDAPFGGSPSEHALLIEINHFEQLAALSAEGDSPQAQSLYTEFARRRRQLLAAIRDGHPEAWRDYPA